MKTDSPKTVTDRIRRLTWWREARFGMFIHWGLYAQPARGEWVMNRERIPVCEYERLADSWHPKRNAARAWAKLAKEAGMKYMVLTTKHHEGFCLWDSAVTDYCAGKRGPKRDLVREYVDACREYGLRVGFYYSLMDWHHPDGWDCSRDESARRRFVDYTYALVRELMSNYGKIDILWYDVPCPLPTADAWESDRINAMARKLQPGIIINDRSHRPEDFGTPEGHITAGSADNGRGWESCMTLNGSWGWQEAPDADWHSARAIVTMLRTCAADAGNLLLNIGPLPDGSVPPQAIDRLRTTGRWLAKHKEAVYGEIDRLGLMEWSNAFSLTRKGTALHLWVTRWTGETLVVAGMRGALRKATLLTTGKRIAFTQMGERIVLTGLSERNPDPLISVAVIRLDFDTVPTQMLGMGCEYIAPEFEPGARHSAFATRWRMSPLCKRPSGNVADVIPVEPADDWKSPAIAGEGFVNVHDTLPDAADGIVYLRNRFRVARAGTWTIRLGHDGGAKLWLDGRETLCEPTRRNPASPWRSKAAVTLTKGDHEIMVALDTVKGLGWGIFFRWELAPSGKNRKASFPEEIGG